MAVVDVARIHSTIPGVFVTGSSVSPSAECCMADELHESSVSGVVTAPGALASATVSASCSEVSVWCAGGSV